jgi:uncharacterized protein (DUF4415 family)
MEQAPEETLDDEEVSFAPAPSPEEARARLAALRGKPLDAPSKLAAEAPVVEPSATPAPAAAQPAEHPDLAATVAALVAESLKKLGRPAEEPKAEAQKATKTDNPLFKVKKVRITTRIDADVLEAFKATGDGWQTKINDVLRQNMP